RRLRTGEARGSRRLGHAAARVERHRDSRLGHRTGARRDRVLDRAPRLRGQSEAGVRGDASTQCAGRRRRHRLGRHPPAAREHLAGVGEPDRPGRPGQGAPPLERWHTRAGCGYLSRAKGGRVEPKALIIELKRRRVFRALVAYGVLAFAILQIIEPVMHGLHWPDAVLSYVIVALGLGFPVVVSLAWIFDVREGRLERADPVQGAGLHGWRLALVLTAIGIVAAAPGIAWNFLWRTRHPARE